MRYNEDFKSLQITEKETESVDAYRGEKYKLINSLLELGLADETEINSKLKFIPYDKHNIKSALDVIINSYSAMTKNSLKHNSDGMQVYRGTTQEEIARVSNSKNIGRFLSTTRSKEMAEGYFSVNWDNPAVVYVKLNGNVPFVDMSDVIEDYGDNWEKETLIAPFTKVDKLNEVSRYNGKRYYSLEISKQDLPEINEKDRKLMYNEIVNSSDEMGTKLKEYFHLDKKAEDIKFKEEFFSNRLSGQNIGKDERTDVSAQLQIIRKNLEKIESDRIKYTEDIFNWKSKLINYCKAECREVEKTVEKQVKQEQSEIYHAEEKKRLEKANNILSELKDDSLSKIKDTISISDSMNNKLDNISNAQNQYERTSNQFGLKYKKWCDPQKDKVVLDDLNHKLHEITSRIEEYSTSISDIDIEYSTKKFKLEELLSSNKEVNAMLSEVQSKNLEGAQQRELNGFKKSINDKFMQLKASSDIKKIEDTEQKINSKSGILKFVDRLTGQKKVDEFHKEQLKKQKRAVSNTVNNLEDFEKKYSIHEIVYKMDKYIIDNKDNSKLKTDIEEMITLRNNIGKTFKVNENHIKSLIESENSKQLVPVNNNKIDKITKLKMETDKWIAQSGYNVEDKTNIKFQLRKPEDNTEYDISKITKYIDTSLESKIKSQELVKKLDECGAR